VCSEIVIVRLRGVCEGNLTFADGRCDDAVSWSPIGGSSPPLVRGPTGSPVPPWSFRVEA